jgi:tetratricopeptide (TPR) repeat protein
LYELLDCVDRDTILMNDGLAYRYGEALFHLGRMAELARFSETYARTARRHSSTEGVLQALNLGGIAAFELGHTVEARTQFELLLELASGEGRTDMLARATNNLGALSNLRGDHRVALTYYRLAIPLYQKQGHTRGLAQSQHNLGLTFRDLSRLADADTAYREAIKLGSGFGYEPIVAMSTIGRSEIAVLSDDANLGLELANRGVDLARRLSDPITEGNGLRVRALARAACGDQWTQTVADLENALGLAADTGNLLLEAEVNRDFGRLLAKREDWPAARDYLATACKLLENLDARAQLTAVREEMERLPAA